eukprot:Skav228726  [mRNA]  locus=scaffold1830:328543:331463:- [translate_table: standard]
MVGPMVTRLRPPPPPPQQSGPTRRSVASRGRADESALEPVAGGFTPLDFSLEEMDPSLQDGAGEGEGGHMGVRV